MLRRLLLAAALALAPSIASAQFATIGPTAATSDNGDRLATTAWVNNFFNLGIPLASGKIFVGSAGGIATAQTMSGDCTLVASGVITCTQAAGNFQVIGNLTVGGSIIDGNGILATNIVAPATPAAGTTRIYVDSTTKAVTFKNDAGTVGNAVVPSTCAANQFGISVSAAGVFGCAQPAISNISGFGTGVATALALNVGSAGAPVTFNGAGGTPSSITLTSGTGLPISTGLSGAGTGVLTALGVNVGSAGAVVVNGGALGTPSSATLTNATGLPTTALTGTLQAAQEPAHTGQMTNSAGSLATVVNSVTGTATNDNASAGNVGEYLATGTTALASGATVTMTIASPCVVTWSGHGFAVGPVTSAVFFSTSGALPTGITAGTTYYLKAIDANTFNIATTADNALAGTFITTTGTQSGAQSADNRIGLATGVSQNIAAMSLAAGDYNITAFGFFVAGASTTVQNYNISVSSTSGTATRIMGRFASQQFSASGTVLSNAEYNVFPVPTFRISLASTTTIYAVGNSTFGTSTAQAAAWMSARRAR